MSICLVLTLQRQKGNFLCATSRSQAGKGSAHALMPASKELNTKASLPHGDHGPTFRMSAAWTCARRAQSSRLAFGDRASKHGNDALAAVPQQAQSLVVAGAAGPTLLLDVPRDRAAVEPRAILARNDALGTPSGPRSRSCWTASCNKAGRRDAHLAAPAPSVALRVRACAGAHAASSTARTPKKQLALRCRDASAMLVLLVWRAEVIKVVAVADDAATAELCGLCGQLPLL